MVKLDLASRRYRLRCFHKGRFRQELPIACTPNHDGQGVISHEPADRWSEQARGSVDSGPRAHRHGSRAGSARARDVRRWKQGSPSSKPWSKSAADQPAGPTWSNITPPGIQGPSSDPMGVGRRLAVTPFAAAPALDGRVDPTPISACPWSSPTSGAGRSSARPTSL